MTPTGLTRRHFMAASLAAPTALSACTPLDRFAEIDRLARHAVTDGAAPGVVVAIGHDGAIVHRTVCGNRALLPARESMTWETRFDMASLTKPTITALAIMQLVEQGALVLDERVAHYLPAFAANGKDAITLRLLLTHYSGLPPDLPLDDPWTGKAEAIRRAMISPLINPPGAKFVYSDINFVVLGLLVERMSNLSLDLYARKAILTPMSLNESTFLPTETENIAPTQFDERGRMLRGVVHDPTARRMGGLAGHAGLFSDAHDMSLYAQSLLDRRAGRPSNFPLRQDTLITMTTPQQPPGKTDLRGLGWDIATHYSSPRGDLFPKGSFGHTGFTGTSLWLDPASDSYVLILTNRVHPDGGHSVVKLRHDIATAAARALGITTHA
ncbi:serine hydrolase domain-containing protein [Kozakia baliensis]|uniref:serine hydrolase domain-containing protein n=1 Tax=Kozakia baliensis TaxID=153496 RepID=UPI0004974B3F|nr:serine hydrolase domain-containing protein [Kozakia baliensis]AOX19574.1 serine hydrolase [Kozakia baliensis]